MGEVYLVPTPISFFYVSTRNVVYRTYVMAHMQCVLMYTRTLTYVYIYVGQLLFEGHYKGRTSKLL